MSANATALATSREFDTTNLAKIHQIEMAVGGEMLFTPLVIPPGVTTTLLRPAFVGVGHQTFILGMFDPILVKLQDGLLYDVGLSTPPPPVPLGGPWSVTSGVGSTEHVCAIAYRHRMTIEGDDLIITESSVSRSMAVTGDATRNWINLPTSPVDSRVTHIVGYVSIAGSPLLEAWERPIGTTSVTESETAFGVEGTTLREPPPYAKYGEYFANSLWLAGNPKHPSRVYRSQQNEPEAFDGATGFLDLPDGEIVTGMKRAGNVLLVFGERCCYAITGFGILTGDYTIDKISPSVGTISHHSLVNIDERVWFLAYDGVYMYDGQRFIYMMDDLRSYFQDDLFQNLTAYQNCHAADHKNVKMYELLIPKPAGHFSYCAFYLSLYSGAQNQPDWFFKTRGRYEYALGVLRVQSDIPRLYTSDTVGFMRRDTDFLQLDDDGDILEVIIQTRFEYGEGSVPTGDERTGKRWVGVDSYLRCDESLDHIIHLQGFGGDESAVEADLPSFGTGLEVGALAGFVAKERYFRIPEALTGDGVSLRWRIRSPTDNMKFKGYRLAWIPGEAARLPVNPARVATERAHRLKFLP